LPSESEHCCLFKVWGQSEAGILPSLTRLRMLLETISGSSFPFRLLGVCFIHLHLRFFRSFIDDNDGIGDLVVLGCIFGYILAEYLGEGIFVDFGGDGHKLLNLFVVAWTFFTLVKKYRKNVNRRVAVTDIVVE